MANARLPGGPVRPCLLPKHAKQQQTTVEIQISTRLKYVTCLVMLFSMMPSSVEVKALVKDATHSRVSANIGRRASTSAHPYWRCTTRGFVACSPLSVGWLLISTTVTTRPGTRRQSINSPTNLSNDSRFGGTTSTTDDTVREGQMHANRNTPDVMMNSILCMGLYST